MRSISQAIAGIEPEYRRKGYAAEALNLLLAYVTSKRPLADAPSTTTPARFPIQPSSLVARIGIDNHPSISLFQKLGFQKTKVVEVFGEVEMRWKGEAMNWPFFKGGREIHWP